MAKILTHHKFLFYRTPIKMNLN